jgi:phthiocerol/phenolphthiocerol synthesis type-I polyketide synthase E
MNTNENMIEKYQDDIAVIAMAGRFPGANSVEKFWSNLEQEVESVTFFNQQQLLQSGVDPVLLDNPNFVGAEGVLQDVEKFDANFFGFSPREAELLDPQHRIFLEVTWELLERAGYSSETIKEVIGVYSGAGASSYLSRNLLTHPEFVRDVGTFKVSLSTGQDFVSTRASYKLGLTGPSININTLCSSSAVAVHYAREALLAYQCDIAIAGGVTISNSREDALFYQEGGIGSFDGHCRTFDARAAGTVAGNGIALVALKRMEDALLNGDQILGVIRASAINNDGGDKASYTAPSPEGQARVITETLEIAGINPETISYVEAHGTGTNLGDPIEVAGLTRAYRRYTDKKNYCGIGSVKTNIGHLVAAGGVASMIKTIMGMQHRQIPASLNFEEPNPKIDFANSPFYVVNKTREWLPTGGDILRAGVSSFGIGGTNAHIILEEAPQLQPSTVGRAVHTVILSAKTATALQVMKRNLFEHIHNNPQLNLADLAFTLQVGRHNFEHRFAANVASIEELAYKLDGVDNKYCSASVQKNTSRELCFMFPGQGSQHYDMARFIYETEPTFKNHIDNCCSILKPLLNLDLRELLYPATGLEADAQEQLKQTLFSQLSLFVTEYSLAQLWMSWGFKPDQMIGHSIGEYVAACLAGVFSLEDALGIVVCRAKLMAQMPTGTMISVPLSEQEIKPYLQDGIWHSVQNAPAIQVLSGTETSIAELIQRLENDGITVTRLHTSHAFHSGMMDQALAPFMDFLSQIKLHPPILKFISNLSGTWAGNEVCEPSYWVDHLRCTVRFSDGVATLLATDSQQFFLEVGPGHTLTSLVRAQLSATSLVANSLPHPANNTQTLWTLGSAWAAMWLSGNRLNWSPLYSGQQRSRLCLPTYPFERKRYWIDAAPHGTRQFKPDIIVSTGQAVDIPNSAILEGVLRVELAPNAMVNAELSGTQWQQVVSLQAEFAEKIKSVLGSSFSIRASGLELRLDSSGEFGTEGSVPPLGLSAEHSRPQGLVSYVEPQTHIQKILAAHWQEVLGYAPVGIHDNFFEVGGHSLMAAALVTRTRKDFDTEVSLRELLETPTIAEISDLLENRIWLQENQHQEEGVEVLEL